MLYVDNKILVFYYLSSKFKWRKLMTESMEKAKHYLRELMTFEGFFTLNEWFVSLDNLRDELRKGNLTLTDIKVSETQIEKLQTKAVKTHFEREIASLRQGVDYKLIVGRIRADLKKYNLTLSDIGTSEEELQSLGVRHYRAEAEAWVNYVKNGLANDDSEVDQIYRYIGTTNLTLADLGINEEELQKFRREACLAGCRWRLAELKTGSVGYKNLLQAIRDYVKKYDLTLDDIKTDEEELERLRVRGCRAVAKSRLKSLRKSNNDGSIPSDYYVVCIREMLKEGNLTLADIGTDEEELRKLS